MLFYDLNDPLQFCSDVEKILHIDGVFHVEIAYLPDIIKKHFRLIHFVKNI